jgi:hypothetical protein
MKLAPVVPKRFHPILRQLDFGMCFVEASVGYHDEQYLRHYQNEALLGKHIMVDNGMAEAGYNESRIGFQDVLDVAEHINADEIIMPDKAKDSKWTLEATTEWARLVPEKNRALVIHGIDWDDWNECLHHMALIGGRTLCIPKMYEDFPGGRAHALSLIYKSGYTNSFDIHLLGLSGNTSATSEISLLNRGKFGVRSIDTGAAVAFAQHYVSIKDHRAKLSMDWKKGADLELVRENLIALRRICYAHKT